jgi:putative PIN family toxin of toxin-antitoxin system
MAEYSDVATRRHLSRRMAAGKWDRARNSIAAVAKEFVPSQVVTDCRDAKDNKYLELALAGAADIIVSSDADLLVLDPWRGIRIVTPAAFLGLLPAA